MEPYVRVVDLWKRYGGRWILRGINLELHSGRIIYIRGSNGSGKTTLLRIIAGLTPPSRGGVTYNCSVPWRSCIGYVGHNPLLYDELTVSENLRYYSTLYGVDYSDITRSRSWTILGIDTIVDRMVSELSYGWRKRVDILRAIIHRPRVLLLDEPFTGLDPDATKSLSSLITELADDGVSVVMTSPRPDKEYLELAMEGYIIKGGALHYEQAYIHN